MEDRHLPEQELCASGGDRWDLGAWDDDNRKIDVGVAIGRAVSDGAELDNVRDTRLTPE